MGTAVKLSLAGVGNLVGLLSLALSQFRLFFKLYFTSTVSETNPTPEQRSGCTKIFLLYVWLSNTMTFYILNIWPFFDSVKPSFNRCL